MDTNYRESSKTSKVNGCLIILSTILFLLIVALVIFLCVILYKKSEDLEREICTKPGCIHAASTILNYMDATVEPCDDFYNFVCGSFMENTEIPEDKITVGSFDSISDSVRDQVKAIITGEVPSNAPKPYHIPKKIYDMCMNTTALEAHGLEAVELFLKEMGSWPLLEGDKWNEGKFDWKQAMYKYRKVGVTNNAFISFYISSDFRNSSRRIIQLGEGGLSLSREYLIEGITNKFVKAFYDYTVDIAVLFGANRKSALKDVNETLELQIAIAKICLPKEETRNTSAFYNLMTIEELQDNYPEIPWLEYITRVLDIPDIDITEDEVINVSVPKYITNVLALLRKTPKRIQANYLMTRSALSQIFYLPERFQRRSEEYNKLYSGRSVTPPRWKSCVGVASGSTYLAIAASYVRRHFNKDSKKQAKEMVIDIQNEFVKILNESDWMDEKTRGRALEKVATMVDHIGYPDELLDDSKIEKFYLNMEVTSNDFRKEMQSLALFFKDYYYKQLREPVNKTEWIRQAFPTTVNAFYSYQENSIKFPAGILQGVFFNKDRPSYMNYGAIGLIIGHEITHGFDDKGRQFDKNGNLANWWEEDTKEAFTKKAQCIIDQYGNYTVPEINLPLNGINTQGENIADNGGIKEAYLAYQTWVKRNGREPNLPGLDYTPNQLFWISAANVWCSKSRTPVLKQQVITGQHPPQEFRVLGPFSNTKFFAKDFNCPLGSNMNPVHKCEVW